MAALATCGGSLRLALSAQSVPLLTPARFTLAGARAGRRHARLGADARVAAVRRCHLHSGCAAAAASSPDQPGNFSA